MTYEQTLSPRRDFKSVRPNSSDYKEDFEKESEEYYFFTNKIGKITKNIRNFRTKHQMTKNTKI
jgi:hypothetical protein